MGILFSYEKEKELQTKLAACTESLRLSRKKNTRVQAINTRMTLHEINKKTGGTRKYRRRS